MVMFSGVGLVVCAVCAAASSGLRESPAAPAEGVPVTLADNRTVLVSTEFIRSQGSDSFPEDVTMTEALLNRNPFLDGSCSLRLMPTADDMALCIKKHKWRYQAMGTHYRRMSEELLFEGLVNRPYNASMYGKWNDCIFKQRRHRHIPGACYGTFHKHNLKGYFKEFFIYIFNDLRYTFDFVLYEPNPETFSKENMFWYLILYLKHLVKIAPDPFDLIDTVKAHQYLPEEFNNITKEFLLLIESMNIVRTALVATGSG